MEISYTAACSNLKPGPEFDLTGSKQILLSDLQQAVFHDTPKSDREQTLHTWTEMQYAEAQTPAEIITSSIKLLSTMIPSLRAACLKRTVCTLQNKVNVEEINDWHWCCSPQMKQGTDYLSCVTQYLRS